MFTHYPLENLFITSPFGMRTHPITGAQQFHNGIDLRAAVNTPIYAPANGTIDSLHQNPIGGKQIIIKHNNNTLTGYAHLNSYNVTKGQQVKAGDIIGYTGNTGITTAPHLHFTYTIDGKKTDPEILLKIIEENRAKNPILASSNILPFVLLAGVGLYIYNNRKSLKL
jgi:murein DD-endopeptidase MepM/ murein hydrolase activator NlpD